MGICSDEKIAVVKSRRHGYEIGLLRTIFFMSDRHERYRDNTTDYEALAVQRDAPRWIKALTRFGFIPAAA